MNETINNSNQAIKTLKRIFKDDFFLELQKLNKTNQELCNYLIKESDEQKIPLVATNENFFLEKVLLILTTLYLVFLNKNILNLRTD